MAPTTAPDPTPVERLQDAERISRALRHAVQEALLAHKRAGNPVAVWRNERVVWVPADEIPVDGHDE